MAAIKKSPLPLFSRAILMVVLTMLFNSASASPTSNEFEECNQFASKRLLYCLNDNINTTSYTCWQKSKSSYESCRSGVIACHDRSKQKELDELSKAIEAMELEE